MQNAFLVRRSVSCWSARKMDKTATKQARDTAHATEKAGVKVYKSILASDKLAAIGRIRDASYTEHCKRTVPWAYDGPGAITAAGYPAYKAAMAEYERDFNRAVDSFIAEYEREYAELSNNPSHPIRVDLGSLYNPADYPSPADLRRRFSFVVTAEPMPQANDFRVQGLAPELVEEIKADIVENNADALANANDTAWSRVIERVEKLKLGLEAYKPGGNGQKVEGKFHDTLIGNIVELVGLIPSINVANDPDLTRLAQKLTALTAYTAQDLRESDALREQIAKQAGAILREITDVYKRAA